MSKDVTASGSHVSDDDLESACRTLESMTAAIEKQCHVLENQQQALRSIRHRDAHTQDTETIQSVRSGEVNRHRARLELEVTESVDRLQEQLQASARRTELTTSGMRSTISGLLDKDDRLLDGLEKAVLHQYMTDSAIASSEEVERLSKALIVLSSDEVHARLDDAYSSAVLSYRHDTIDTDIRLTSQSLSQQRDSLRSELEELCREIDSLSTMAVEYQHRTPIARALGTAASDVRAEKLVWSDYLSATLRYLTDRLEVLDSQNQHAHLHQAALEMLSGEFTRVVNAMLDNTHLSRSKPQSPVKVSQKGLKPLRLVQANLSDNQDPAAQLLRQLDVRVADLSDHANLLKSVKSASARKSTELTSLSTNTERSLSDHVAQSLDGTQTHVQALAGAVTAQSMFGTVRLTNQSTRLGIDQLKRDTEETGTAMRELNMDEFSESIKEQQHIFMEQWRQ